MTLQTVDLNVAAGLSRCWPHELLFSQTAFQATGKRPVPGIEVANARMPARIGIVDRLHLLTIRTAKRNGMSSLPRR